SCFLVPCERVPGPDLAAVKEDPELAATGNLSCQEPMEYDRQVPLHFPTHKTQPAACGLTVGMLVAQDSVEPLPENHGSGGVLQRGGEVRGGSIPGKRNELPSVRLFDVLQVPAVRCEVKPLAASAARNRE